MKTRIFAALGALAVAGAVVLGVSGTAFAAAPVPAASQMDCNNAAAATATAQTNFNNSLATLVARAKELGFTTQQITDAEKAIAGATSIQAAQNALMMVYFEHPVTGFDKNKDLALVGNVVNAKFALSAAMAQQAVSCAGFTPMVVMPMAPAATPAMPAPTYTMPAAAPQTGDGSSLSGR